MPRPGDCVNYEPLNVNFIFQLIILGALQVPALTEIWFSEILIWKKVKLPAPRGGASLAQLKSQLRRQLLLVSMLFYIFLYRV